MTSFQLRNSDECDLVLFFLFDPVFDTAAVIRKSCNSNAGFGANIDSEHSWNSLQLVKMSELKKRAYETSSEETKC